jgi:hypothetical protein
MSMLQAAQPGGSSKRWELLREPSKARTAAAQTLTWLREAYGEPGLRMSLPGTSSPSREMKVTSSNSFLTTEVSRRWEE